MNDNKPKTILTGKITIGDIDIECYHLENNIRVISGGGLQKALGFVQQKTSGDKLKNIILSPKNKDFSAAEYEVITSGFDKNKVLFISPFTKGAISYATGYEATFLIDICHYIQDLYLSGYINKKYEFIYDKAKAISRAFSKVGIIAVIDEATGYQEKRDREELKKIFAESLLRDLPSDKKREFDKVNFFDGLHKIYKIPVKKDKPNQHPSFFGKFIIKYIYNPLDGIMTDGKITTFGIVWEVLDEKNPVMYIENKRKGRKYTMYQFINEVGEITFFRHLSVISALMNISSNKRQFESHFAKQFKLPHQDNLFEEEE